jgi:DNA-binding transcriptional MocR family regulator
VIALRRRIADTAPGTRLPSTRALVAEFGASPVTVQRAMRQLVALGLAESRPGVGTFTRAVRTTRPLDHGWQSGALGPAPGQPTALSATQRSAAPDAISLHSGYPARELLPERLVRAAIARAARNKASLTRSPAGGMPELQAWFAGRIADLAPAGVTPPTARDVIITAGSQSGLTSVFRSLVGTGRPLLVESPTYWGAVMAARQIGVVLVPVPTGPDGPDPELVARAFADTGARAFYAQPTYANPTGGQWAAETGRAVLDVVRAADAFLIEDDWAHDLAIDPAPGATPLVALDDGHVVHLRSLTKSVSPALRVAAVVARGPARDRILADRAAEAMYVSGLLQAAALDVVSQPGWATHLRAMRQQLRSRRDLLLASVLEHAPGLVVDHVPAGGLNLWARLPDGLDATAYARACETHGVVVAPGDEWFPAEPAGPYVRLNFSGEAPDRFPDAARVLGRVLASMAEDAHA